MLGIWDIVIHLSFEFPFFEKPTYVMMKLQSILLVLGCCFSQEIFANAIHKRYAVGVPVDKTLKPCGDAWYEQSQVSKQILLHVIISSYQAVKLSM